MEPKYSIKIQPGCENGTLNRLFISITLEAPERKELETLCSLRPCEGYPAPTFTQKHVQAQDDNGSLEMLIASSEDQSAGNWKVKRDTAGDVSIRVEMRPDSADATTHAGLDRYLRCNQGGIFGIGGAFLPRATYSERFTFSLEWDLSLAPLNTRVSWSYGEGTACATMPGPMDLLLNAAFMVGPIESFPANLSNTDGEDNISTMHWFGQFPEMFQPIRDLDKEIFLYARTLFKDPDGSHKVYLQKVARGSAGHNFNSCYVVEYCDDIPWIPTGVIHVCTHEMVHTWLYLGDEPDGYQNFWFIEGIANFYALYVPVRAGVNGVEYFRELLDGFLCAYYTSPLVTTPLKDIGSGFHGQIIPYTRGVLYLLFTDAMLRRASAERRKDCNPIDEVVLAILDKYYKGDVTNASLWLDTLYPYLGKDVVDGQFHSRMNGTVLQPDPLFTSPVGGKVITLEAVDQEAMDVGFDSKSFETRIIEGLVPGSRAELAGLRNGDELLGNTNYSASKYNVEKKARVTVKREGVPVDIEYRPRSFTKVRSFRTALSE